MAEEITPYNASRVMMRVFHALIRDNLGEQHLEDCGLRQETIDTMVKVLIEKGWIEQTTSVVLDWYLVPELVEKYATDRELVKRFLKEEAYRTARAKERYELQLERQARAREDGKDLAWEG